ncbi:hypothetical protein WMY93_020067 [Mugilogobius chulae]|uniref:Uncharacterized protein n=1 Tax=Mugilogobius chulae TaxID=88201 RepID=A0AAW0NLV7_9GOBI
MSMQTLPLVFINLGGEMLYILDQRLKSNNTSEDGSDRGLWTDGDRKRVLTDIVETLFSKTFMDELFKPQQLYSHRTMKTVLSRLAQGSIMRLNPALWTGKRFVAYHSVLTCFCQVSLFLKSQIQNPNGRFVLGTTGPVPQGVEVPGLIRMFDCRGRELQRCQFTSGGDYTSSIREGSFEIHGDRVLKLGLNIYSVVNPEETHTSKAPTVKTESRPNPLAKEELNLLSRLMGTLKSESKSESGSKPGSEKSFRISLFPSDQEEDEAGAVGGAEESWSGVINIQAMQDVEAASELAQILGQFTETEEEESSETQSCTKGDELLALMDELG